MPIRLLPLLENELYWMVESPSLQFLKNFRQISNPQKKFHFFFEPVRHNPQRNQSFSDFRFSNQDRAWKCHIPTALMLSHSRTARLVSKPVVRPLPSASIPIRTRNDSDDEGPSRPKKRTKNKSDSDIDDRTMGDFEKVPQLIREEVRCALEQHAQGDDDGYLCIKKIYASKRMIEDEPSTAKLRLYTMALLGNVSSLNRSRSELVHTVLNSKWLGRNEDYATLFVRFTANLASTQGVFLVDVLQMLVDNLTAGKLTENLLKLKLKLKQL